MDSRNLMEKLREFFNTKSLGSLLNDPKFIGTSAAIVMAFYYMRHKGEREAIKSSFDCQSIELPGSEGIRVNAKKSTLVSIDELECKTVPELFMKGVHSSGKNPFLGTRADANSNYEWISYNEVYEKSQRVGFALYELGYRKGDLVGISAMNKPEWIMVDQGAMMFSMVLVPLYSTLGAEGMNHILQQTELSILFSDLANLRSLLNENEKTGFLRNVVTFENVTDADVIERCRKFGVKLMSFEEFLDIGKQHPHDKVLPVSEDLAIICYTSGTTGRPKGVMLSHKNIATNIESFNTSGYKMTSTDLHFSYLPLSHVYERMAHYLVMSSGCRIGFFRGNVKELIDDMKVLKPTLFAAVPRVLNVIHDKVMNEISQSWFKSFLFKTAMKAKEDELSRGIIRRDSFWDKLVFSKIQQILGGRIEAISTGAAPLSESVKKFFRCAFGCQVFEGYGQTELTAMATCMYALDPVIGHVGPPASCCRIKLVDVADMEYFAKDGKGEVCVQGPSVFQGYFKDLEKTRETIDDEGWCHTGDIGKWLPNGALCIIDRKKHIFKLAQGEYIAPEKVEIAYMRSPFVSQIYVTGNSLQTYTVAIICPDQEYLQEWASKHHVTGSVQELCENELVNNAVLESLKEAGTISSLNSLEQVKAVYLTSKGFTIEDGLLTPTMKAKRNKIEEIFAAEIAALYNTKTMAHLLKK